MLYLRTITFTDDGSSQNIPITLPPDFSGISLATYCSPGMAAALSGASLHDSNFGQASSPIACNALTSILNVTNVLLQPSYYIQVDSTGNVTGAQSFTIGVEGDSLTEINGTQFISVSTSTPLAINFTSIDMFLGWFGFLAVFTIALFLISAR